jgi:TRAP-type uncharacterized transport system substrate-binding protein
MWVWYNRASRAWAIASDVVSLGSVFYQPVTVFYRSRKVLLRLSELRAQRIAIGPDGSGTRFLALALLKANEIEPEWAHDAARAWKGRRPEARCCARRWTQYS